MKIENKYEMLFIRACKTEDSFKRVVSVYKRFYSREPRHIPNIMGLLAEICDKYFDVKLSRLLSDLSPNSSRRIVYHETPYYEHAIHLLISEIRFCKIEKLESIGYRVPRMFR